MSNENPKCVCPYCTKTFSLPVSHTDFYSCPHCKTHLEIIWKERDGKMVPTFIKS